ncbi:MAG: ComEC family competence protein [Chitinispirillaceae bacterium]|jgi:ComEC/Rec2-related protein|nr:ComEC family competence protein [Chitinispirillaceae bacterium]
MALFRHVVIALFSGAFPALRLWCRLPGLVSWTSMSIGCAAAFFLPVPAIPGSAVFLLIALALTGILSRPPLARFAAFLLFAFMFCSMRINNQSEVYRSLSKPPALAISGKVVSPPMTYLENFKCLLVIDSCDPALDKLRGKTAECISPSEPRQYERIMVRGLFSPPSERKNPYEYDEFNAMMAAGIWGRVTAVSYTSLHGNGNFLQRLGTGFRGITIATLRKVADYDNRALLQACFLGETGFLSPYIKTIFRESGIYHLIAISGLNTAMLTAAVFFLLHLFRVSRSVSLLICIAVLWAYLPFVGMIPSLFRATIMATIVIAAFLFEKKMYAMQAIGLAGTFWLLVSPQSLFTPGYQLTFAATTALVGLVPVFSRLTPVSENPVLQRVISFVFLSFNVSFACFLATAPILVYHFGYLSVFGLFANLVAVSAMTLSMWAFFAGLFLQMIMPPLAFIPLWISERFMDAVVATAQTGSFFKWSIVSVPVPPAELTVLFSLFLIGLMASDKRRVGRYLQICLATAILIVPADLMIRHAVTKLEVVRFEVPKSEVLGIKWPNGNCWLVLTKGNRPLPRTRSVERHVLPWIRHRCANRVDVLVVPADRTTDAEELKKQIPALTKAKILTAVSAGALFTPCKKCTLSLSGAAVRVVAPGRRGRDTTIQLMVR